MSPLAQVGAAADDHARGLAAGVRVDDADGYGRIEVHSWERAAAQNSIIVDAVKRPAVTKPESMRDPTRHARSPHVLPVAADRDRHRAEFACRSGSGRRPGENAARRPHQRGTELRSAVLRRRRLRRHHRSHLRLDAGLRLPGSPGEARAEDARGDADGRSRRRDLRFQAEARHLLHARPGFQRQAARADRGRSGVCAQAAARSGGEEPLAVDDRGQDHRRGRGPRASPQVRQIRLRRTDRGSRGRRPLHAAHPSEAARSALPLRFRRAQHCGGRARGRRGVWAGFRRASGRHRTVHAGRIPAQRPDRAAGQSRFSRHDLCACRTDPARGDADRGSAQGKEAAAGRPHRDLGDRGRAGGVARLREPRARPARAASAGICRAGAGRRRASARARGQRYPARGAAAAQHALDLFQHGRPGGRRLHAGRRSRCGARSAWATT